MVRILGMETKKYLFFRSDSDNAGRIEDVFYICGFQAFLETEAKNEITTRNCDLVWVKNYAGN